MNERIRIMKKNYNQPMVEAVEVQAASMLLDSSPATGNIDLGGGGGGSIDPD